VIHGVNRRQAHPHFQSGKSPLFAELMERHPHPKVELEMGQWYATTFAAHPSQCSRAKFTGFTRRTRGYKVIDVPLSISMEKSYRWLQGCLDNIGPAAFGRFFPFARTAAQRRLLMYNKDIPVELLARRLYALWWCVSSSLTTFARLIMRPRHFIQVFVLDSSILVMNLITSSNCITRTFRKLFRLESHLHWC